MCDDPKRHYSMKTHTRGFRQYAHESVSDRGKDKKKAGGGERNRYLEAKRAQTVLVIDKAARTNVSGPCRQEIGHIVRKLAAVTIRASEMRDGAEVVAHERNGAPSVSAQKDH